MQIISPLYDEAEHVFLSKTFENLKKDGYLFLEMEDFSSTYNDVKKAGEILQKWEEFPDSDPYQYALHKIYIDKDNNLVFEKNFIPRNEGSRSSFKNVIKNYTRGQIKKLLEDYGYTVSLYSMNNENEIELQTGGYLHDFYRVLAKKTEE